MPLRVYLLPVASVLLTTKPGSQLMPTKTPAGSLGAMTTLPLASSTTTNSQRSTLDKPLIFASTDCTLLGERLVVMLRIAELTCMLAPSLLAFSKS
eukprot:18450-Heterococcus_DN1.PRE.2